MPPPTQIVAHTVAVGIRHTCAAVEGTAYCWGDGNGVSPPRSVGSPRPTSVNIVGAEVTGVAAGDMHSCALDREGRVFCWGSNASHECGVEWSYRDAGTPLPTVAQVASPGPVPHLPPCTALDAWGTNTCAVATDGEVFCWGADELGQTGHGAVSGEPQMPGPVLGVSDAVDVAVGKEHACALDAHGFVWCWGNNAHGELGSDPSEARGSASRVVSLTNIIHVSAGLGFTCAVDEAGRVWCWGRNDAAQLGDASGEDRGEPRPVDGLRARKVFAGFDTSCAIALDGVVWCWGVNAIDFGDFPEDGAAHEVVAHARPTSLGGIAEIAPGPWRHSCARTTAGAVVCWGQGGRPELGRPTAEGYAGPGEVEGLP